MDTIISKIKNLLNKTTHNGCSVEESATASMLAQKLIEKHQLSLADINGFSTDEKIEDNTTIYNGQRVVHWKSALAGILCRMNNCGFYMHHNYEGVNFKIVGRKTDTELVSYMFSYLCNEIESLAKRLNPGGGKTWSNNFKFGAVSAISERLKEGKAAARSEATSSAIVKVDARGIEVEQWMGKNLNLKTAKPYAGGAGNHGAYAAGREAGSKIDLNRRGIGGSSSSKLLK